MSTNPNQPEFARLEAQVQRSTDELMHKIRNLDEKLVLLTEVLGMLNKRLERIEAHLQGDGNESGKDATFIGGR